MAADPKSGEWIAVCAIDRLDENGIVCANASGLSLLIIRDGDHVYACERACPHEQADLAQGRVQNGKLHCPRHLAWFDLASGAISPGWTSRALRRYPARLGEGNVWVSLRS